MKLNSTNTNQSVFIKAGAGLLAATAIFLACSCGQGETETQESTAESVTFPEISIVYDDTAISEKEIPNATTTADEADTEKHAQTEMTTDGTTKTVASTAEQTTQYAYAYAGFSPVIADIDSQSWNLLLVNRHYILPDDFEVNLSAAIEGSDVKLDSRVAPHYAQMYAAAKKDGITLTPLSGYRSISRQRINFENKISLYKNQGYSKAEATQLAAKIILPPGTSEHNAGLAMDICSLDTVFDQTSEYAWLSEHAAEYGFIERYTQEKIDVTQITYEPWHWRYVGVQYAPAIKASGLCLEEYLETMHY